MARFYTSVPRSNTSSSTYSSAISVSSTQTVKAYAVKTNYVDSSFSSATVAAAKGGGVVPLSAEVSATPKANPPNPTGPSAAANAGLESKYLGHQVAARPTTMLWHINQVLQHRLIAAAVQQRLLLRRLRL